MMAPGGDYDHARANIASRGRVGSRGDMQSRDRAIAVEPFRPLSQQGARAQIAMGGEMTSMGMVSPSKRRL